MYGKTTNADKVLNENIVTSQDQSTEIANDNRVIDRTTSNESVDEREHDTVDTLQSEDDDDDIEEDELPTWGPGRPWKILTGKWGRPTKMYHLKRLAVQPDQSIEEN